MDISKLKARREQLIKDLWLATRQEQFDICWDLEQIEKAIDSLDAPTPFLDSLPHATTNFDTY